MGQLLYESMTGPQAADALDEHLAERGPALERLRSALLAHGRDPATMLDGSLVSVAPLWAWITSLAGKLGVDPRPLAEDPTRPTWPSWARHATLVDPHPPAETLALVDGFASYLARIITAEVPEARWESGHHRINDFPLLNRPEASTAEEALVTVAAEVDCFDVGLREDIVAGHPALVEWLIAELSERDAVKSVHR
ncbi:hypothetical protein [Kocuria dechangensis]|nr:hypothetical protein [Kocuria dechangensis]